MSDDKVVSDETKPVADAPVNTASPKTYSEEEFKKAVAERDKAKERLRLIDEETKKAAEAKAIEEGRIKEILADREAKLAEAEKKAKAYEESQAKVREKALANIKDPELKKFAEALPSVEMVLEFSEKVTQTKITPFTDKTPPAAGEPIKFKSAREWEKTLREQGQA